MGFNLVYIQKGVYEENTPGYGIYLINNSDIEYKVGYSTYGFFSDDDRVIQTEPKSKSLGEILPHSRLMIEEGDIGQLDIQGFVDLSLYNGNDKIKLSFQIGKGEPEGEKVKIDGFSDYGIEMIYEVDQG